MNPVELVRILANAASLEEALSLIVEYDYCYELNCGPDGPEAKILLADNLYGQGRSSEYSPCPAKEAIISAAADLAAKYEEAKLEYEIAETDLQCLHETRAETHK